MQKKGNLNRPKPRKMQKKKSSSVPHPKAQNLSPRSKIKKNKQSIDSKSKKVTNQNKLNWQIQYETLNNKYQFLLAEYANYKKNNLKQMENLRKYEGQHLIQQLLTKVMDNFERALEQEINQQNIIEFKKGISMIYENLKNLLKEIGVKEVNCEGQPFDPAVHCALDSTPSEDLPPEHILHVIKKAYIFHDKLLRPAEVIVSQKTESENLLQNKDASEQQKKLL